MVRLGGTRQAACCERAMKRVWHIGSVAIIEAIAELGLDGH